MNKQHQHIILCNGIKLPTKFKSWPESHVLQLNYNTNTSSDNTIINLPHFIKIANCHFPDRIKDLLEIAGYIYSADRLVKRGQNDQLEFQRWPRDLHFFIKVRDLKFWNSRKIKNSLSELLVFVSGDKNYEFTFLSGAKDIGQKNLFDNESIHFDSKDNSLVALFSGGLDSLAGALNILNKTDKKLIIIAIDQVIG